MTSSLARQKVGLLWDLVRGLAYIPGWISLSHDTYERETVGNDFFGINVASSEDPRCDDYVVGQLRAANINYVRLCWDIDSKNDFHKRFLDRLLDERFDVMVALLPTFADAQQLEIDNSAQLRWREFVGGFLSEYGGRVALVEIGTSRAGNAGNGRAGDGACAGIVDARQH